MSSIRLFKMVEWKALVYWMSLLLTVTDGEFFTSLTQMKGLVRLESALSKSLDSYLKQSSKAPGIIRQFAYNPGLDTLIKIGWGCAACFSIYDENLRYSLPYL